MKSLLIGGTVITNKSHAMDFIARTEKFLNEKYGFTFEAVLAMDSYKEKLVSAGFLTWEEAEQAECLAY